MKMADTHLYFYWCPSATSGSRRPAELNQNWNRVAQIKWAQPTGRAILGMNAYSGSGDFDGAQQYVITVNPSGQAFAAVDNWINGSTQLINDFVPMANLSGAKLPQGYTLTIALQNDGVGNITGAIYTMTDNNGNT